MPVDGLLKGLIEEKPLINLPDDLPCNENVELLSLTSEGLKERARHAGDTRKKYKMLWSIGYLKSKVESGKITKEQAIEEFKGYAGHSKESRCYALQKVEDLIREGMCTGDTWYLHFDIFREEYQKLFEMVKSGFTTVSSLSKLWNMPEEKIRIMGKGLAKRGFIITLPGTVKKTRYTFKKIPIGFYRGKCDFRWVPLEKRDVTFLDRDGKETKVAFLPKNWRDKKDEEIERADQRYMDRVILKTLQGIEKGDVEVNERKMKPTIGGIIRPFAHEKLGNKRNEKNEPSREDTVKKMLDYFPTLQACRVINFDYESLENHVGKKKFESINRKSWSKHRFDLFEKRNSFSHRKKAEKYLDIVKSKIETTHRIFSSYTPTFIEKSESNMDKVAYLFTIVSGFKFASKFLKDERERLGIRRSRLDDVGAFKLTKRGEKMTDSNFPITPYVEIAPYRLRF